MYVGVGRRGILTWGLCAMCFVLAKLLVIYLLIQCFFWFFHAALFFGCDWGSLIGGLGAYKKTIDE
jgi:hypothetical protein